MSMSINSQATANLFVCCNSKQDGFLRVKIRVCVLCVAVLIFFMFVIEWWSFVMFDEFVCVSGSVRV